MPKRFIEEGRDGRPRIYIEPMADGGYTWRVGYQGAPTFAADMGRAFAESIVRTGNVPSVIIYKAPRI